MHTKQVKSPTLPQIASATGGHSAEYFGAQRNFWWNADFVELLAHRWALHTVHKALDVGCGIGHWSRVLLPFLPAWAQLYGVDAEQRWVDAAAQAMAQMGAGGRCHFSQALAQNLPFADNSFDFVTCQTLLIHVQDIKQVIAEMLRVLRPGGRIALVEPNNLARCVASAEVVDKASMEKLLNLMRLQMMCECGKAQLGFGHNSAGEIVPSVLRALDVQSIEVRLNDKAFALLPPYGTEHERAAVEQSLAWSERGFWIWSKDETARYFKAAGGQDEEFEQLWRIALDDVNSKASALKAGTGQHSGGVMSYIISGIKK